MKAKNILMICLFISGLFCLPSKAQQPGENVSSQTIRKLGEKHFFSISTIPDDIFRLMQGKTSNIEVEHIESVKLPTDKEQQVINLKELIHGEREE